MVERDPRLEGKVAIKTGVESSGEGMSRAPENWGTGSE